MAARYFAGHAVMVLGIAPDPGTPSERIVGVPGFEAHELRRAIIKRTGEPGPHWDYVLIDVPESMNSVSIIIVDPPSGQIWPCLGDDVDLHDGTVYVRRDGETSKASGPELSQLLRRHVEHAQPRHPAVDLAVRLTGAAHRLDPLNQPLDSYLERHTSALRWAYDQRREERAGGFPALNSLSVLGGVDRTPQEYANEIEAWVQAMRERWPQIVCDFATIDAPGVSIEITNATTTFLTGVHLDITLTGAPDLWLGNRPCAIDEQGEAVEVLFEDVPERPELWGPRPYTGITVPRLPTLLPQNFNQPALAGADQSVTISHRIGELRPGRPYRASFEHEVLLFLPPDASSAPMTGRWAITADNHHEVYEGDLELLVADKLLDVSEILLQLLEGHAGPIPSE